MLGRLAASRIAVPFSVIVTAERAGWYKPDERPYRLALDELGVEAERCLFVAGSAYDLFGTARVGLATYWHDRIGMTLPPDAPKPLTHHRTLTPLLAYMLP
jgi:FMN phosphatase YigB (HAD superfamily)